MRINVYSQELTDEVRIVRKESNTGIVYSAVQMMLHSSSMLHHSETDDDRSAVTFWLPTSSTRRAQLAATFERLAELVRVAALQTEGTEGGEMSAIYWLIERNSKHKNMPPNEPIMWFRGRSRFAQGDVDYWTPHADRAKHFHSKESAEEYALSFTGDDYDPPPDVTEHMDVEQKEGK